MKGLRVRVVRKVDSAGGDLGYSLELVPEFRKTEIPIQGVDLTKEEMLGLREELDRALGIAEISRIFNLNNEQALEILQFHMKRHSPCDSCQLYMKECYDCVFTYKDPIDNYVFRHLVSGGGDRRDAVKNIASHSDDIRREHESFPECKFNYDYWKEYPCAKKNECCWDCIYTCESPLERQLFMALAANFKNIELQKRVYKDGTVNSNPSRIDKSTILTIPDFYLEMNDKRICIYADGFTYHNSERATLRDRNIDRELQNFGFLVLRYPTNDITEQLKDTMIALNKFVHS